MYSKEEWDKLPIKDEKGTINWFNCKEKLPPIPEENIYCSDDVLVWKDGLNPVVGAYFRNNTWKHKSTEPNWQPTHWAYINYPE